MGGCGLFRKNRQGRWGGFMLYVKVLLGCAKLQCETVDIPSEMGEE